MHIVPAPAESLMKSRVLSIPGLQGVKDETWDGYRLFRLSGGAGAWACSQVGSLAGMSRHAAECPAVDRFLSRYDPKLDDGPCTSSPFPSQCCRK